MKNLSTLSFVKLFNVPISIINESKALALIGEWLREWRSSTGSKSSTGNTSRKTTSAKIHATCATCDTCATFPKIIVTPNPEIIVAAQSDPALMQALQSADLSIPDGVGVVWALRLLMSKTIDDRKWKVGAEDRKSKIDKSDLSSTFHPLPPFSIFNHLSSNINRLSGLDLIESLILQPQKVGPFEPKLKIMLLGARPGVAQAAAAVLRRKFEARNSKSETNPNYQNPKSKTVSNLKHLNLKFVSNFDIRISDFKIHALSGPQDISTISKSENNRLIAQINSFQPDLLFAAFGHPKQEKWLSANRYRLNAGVAMAVGGAIDQIANPSLRPPPYINSIGLGWLYRLLRQPWRWKRQLALIKFVLMVAKDLLS